MWIVSVSCYSGDWYTAQMINHSWPYARPGMSMTTTYELWIVDLDTVHFHGQYTTYIACVLSIVFLVSQNGQSPTSSCSTIFLVSCRTFSWHPTSRSTGHMIYQLVPFVIQNSWQLHEKSMSFCCLRLDKLHPSPALGNSNLRCWNGHMC